MKVYSFAEFFAEVPLKDMPKTIIRDITHLPKDLVDTIDEYIDMYEKYSNGDWLDVGQTAKNVVKEAIIDTLKGIWEFLIEYGYWIALFGGITAIILYLCGHRGALKWAWTAFIGYIFICAIGMVL